MKKVFVFIAASVFVLVPLAAQSVSIVGPDEGDHSELNTQMTIGWNYQNAGSHKVIIVLRNSNGTVGTIADQVPLSDGVVKWTVGQLLEGTPVLPGDDYRIRIRILPNVAHDDGNTFFIVPTKEHLGLLSFNNGGKWTRGKKSAIKWYTKNWSGTVRLDLWQNGSFRGNIATNLKSNSNLFPWEVGILADGTLVDFGGGYRIRISKEYQGLKVPKIPLQDMSESDFNIMVLKPDELHPDDVKQ